MNGKLYGVGVGPGDPELITLKAKRILEGVDTIIAPKTAEGKKSLALSIITDVCNIYANIVELVFPMTHSEETLKEKWEQCVNVIEEKLKQGKNVAFITLGDPSIYSTFGYIHKMIKQKDFKCEMIPGVTSFCASAAKLGVSLVEDKEALSIVPVGASEEEFLEKFDNIVLMKVSTDYKAVLKKLRTKNLLEKSVQISKCGLPEQEIIWDIKNNETKNNVNYFTTMIVKKNGVN